jgi:putative ATP-dependent endonuclease of OLD family
MKIEHLHIRFFRTLVDLELHFKPYYTAICGRNDCGKTNIVRAMRNLMREDEPFTIREEQKFSLKTDFPKWLSFDTSSSRISIEVDLVINSERDAGLYEFINTYLSLKQVVPNLRLTITSEFGAKESEHRQFVTVEDERFTDIRAQEVIKKVQSARVILFHNSAYEDRQILFRPQLGGYFRELSGKASKRLESMKATVDRDLKKIAKGQQREIEELLGRLESKYRVGVSIPSMGFEYVPFNMTLGDAKMDVSLDEWGSGTRNRTQILLTLLRAKQVADSAKSASKITPIIIVEEPESFLHPSAQAEFGRILQNLAEEFQVQVITTTHSPYMLSLERPESNILLERKIVRRQQRETVRVDSSAERWMEPFGQALGVNNADFAPWKDVLFTSTNSILLVEGEIDVEYFKLLRDPAHCLNQLKFDGEIFPYGGRDNLKNTVLLRFIINRYRTVFVTYDLDAEDTVESCLMGLGLEKKRHYASVGLDESGRRCIEGLVPTSVSGSVYAANPELVQKAMSSVKNDAKSAKQELKKKIFEEFKNSSQPNDRYFGNFYPLVRIINRALCK